MFQFNYGSGATFLSTWGVWLLVFVLLFALNEVTRRFKYVGLFTFTVLPVVLSVLWFTVLKDTTYTDWFHLAKVYSATAGCLGFWLIRYLKGTNKKTGKEWRLADKKWALCFPPLILAINIMEAVARDIEVGIQYNGGGILSDGSMFVLGGPWNFLNATAGILNIITITGWLGIKLRKKTAADKSQDMVWPDMLWFWIIAYDLWNFTYTYNCLPGHSWYCGFALLLAPTLCAFTVGKGAWLQHRAHTLAIWCMFAQTVPAFIDKGAYAIQSTYNETALMFFGVISLLSNIAVLAYMVIRTIKTKTNPYTKELYTNNKKYKEVAAIAE
ncbi:DUF5692 family protein [Anaerocolumna sp. AGMB13020]|uniref:DUF5692 family protein n=1 Tax=Anaerocolumna sp. AGMB13020 TaxID=3081750 RepID=UPI00295477B4|nr:DUF5692 family protein [Anaerocolumna sp. AGMB13020]WOO36800.1 DUF5692 family protein [Anaerocolumna sp. AGMB13020]